jgi:hypothetical protein
MMWTGMVVVGQSSTQTGVVKEMASSQQEPVLEFIGGQQIPCKYSTLNAQFLYRLLSLPPHPAYGPYGLVQRNPIRV